VPTKTGHITRFEFIALVASMMALNSLAIDVMLPALPAIGEALGIHSENERQFVIVAYVAGFGLAQLAYGPLGDSFGRRGPLLAGMILYVACAVAAAFISNSAALFALRFLQGLGAAGTRVLSNSVIRDRYSGDDMAKASSLALMVFMAMPIVAPGIGQLILLLGTWQTIFLWMGGLACAVTLWTFFRLPETLHPENRRPLRVSTIGEAFWLVASNRTALCYGLCGALLTGCMFGFIVSCQQIFTGIYDLGPWFPLAFASVAGVLALASFLNSRLVKRYGMRRLSLTATVIFIVGGTVFLTWSSLGTIPFSMFLLLVLVIQFAFGFLFPNLSALAAEPLGSVAGTAASVFGFMQTVGGALLGAWTGQSFNGTTTPLALSWVVYGVGVALLISIAEGRLKQR
jgi:DHA1 family bicyclomycin/chloramphenicol resistance-like MFS transporter